MKVNTVNVTKMSMPIILGIRSFSDDPEGNKEANQCFRDVLKKQNVSDEDIEAAVKDGYRDQGDYQLFITHSS